MNADADPKNRKDNPQIAPISADSELRVEDCLSAGSDQIVTAFQNTVYDRKDHFADIRQMVDRR